MFETLCLNYLDVQKYNYNFCFYLENNQKHCIDVSLEEKLLLPVRFNCYFLNKEKVGYFFDVKGRLWVELIMCWT